MIIAQISDTHILAESSGEPIWHQRARDLERTVAQINALSPSPDFVIHTGDVTHNGLTNEYGLAHELLGGLRMPLHAIVGNRDRREPFLRAFNNDRALSRAGKFVQYGVDLGDIKLIALDTQSLSSGLGDLCSNRLAAFETLLAETHDAPTVIIMHHPPVGIPALSNPHQFERREVTDAFAALVAKNHQIIRILCGHIHRADMAEVAGVSVSTMPSIATDLRNDATAGRSSQPVFQVHAYSGASELSSCSHIVGDLPTSPATQEGPRRALPDDCCV